MKIHLFPDVSKLFLIARQSVEHGDSVEKGGQSLLENLVDRVTGQHSYPAHEDGKQRDQLLVLSKVHIFFNVEFSYIFSIPGKETQ